MLCTVNMHRLEPENYTSLTRSRLVFDYLTNFPPSEIVPAIPLGRKFPQVVKSLSDLTRQLM
jgi:hypothetical protein